MNHGSLFSGIGGFDLASEWCGWNNVFQVEIDEFCQKILTKNFPNTEKFLDIKKFDGTIFKGRIDVLSGGFPCQPFSQAGKQKGKDDNRFLWHEMLRAIREVQPTWIVAENVSGLLTMQNGLVFEQVCSEMEKENYEVQPFIIPACSINAPHRRDRIWIVAKNTKQDGCRIREHDEPISFGNKRNISTGDEVWVYIEPTNSNAARGINGKLRNKSEEERSQVSNKLFGNDDRLCGDAPNTNANRHLFGQIKKLTTEERLNAQRNASTGSWTKTWYEVATEFCRMDDGISDRVDRLKGLGNAIVPQVAYEIFKAIEMTYAEHL